MDNPYRIMGIDASLSSTGICVVDCVFDEDILPKLLVVLLDTNLPKDDKWLCKYFNIKQLYEIKEDKDMKKHLTKTRKRIREERGEDGFPHISDTRNETALECSRTNWQVERILEEIENSKPKMVIMEDYSYHSPGSITQLAELRGALKERMIKKGICFHTLDKNCECYDLLFAPIGTVKKVASTKGNANKKQVAEGLKRFPLYLNISEDEDDKNDALSICLTTFYVLYFMKFGFVFPDPTNSKEKAQIKSWKSSFDKFSCRIGGPVDSL